MIWDSVWPVTGASLIISPNISNMVYLISSEIFSIEAWTYLNKSFVSSVELRMVQVLKGRQKFLIFNPSWSKRHLLRKKIFLTCGRDAKLQNEGKKSGIRRSLVQIPFRQMIFYLAISIKVNLCNHLAAEFVNFISVSYLMYWRRCLCMDPREKS